MATCPPLAGMINPLGLNPIGLVLQSLLPLDIYINWGSAGQPNSPGFWQNGIALLGNPGIGRDHTVVFSYPGQITGGTPPSMVFNSANYFNQQNMSFTVSGSGLITINYSITAIGGFYVGTRLGSIQFTI